MSNKGWLGLNYMSSLFWTLGLRRSIYSDLMIVGAEKKKENIGHEVLTQSFCSKVNINHFHSYLISQTNLRPGMMSSGQGSKMLPQGGAAKVFEQ